MSNTFYIKKTAFDNNNLDFTYRATDSFIIGPGELNGPAGAARVSDLELYGYGAIKWGEGVNQNQYRLTENFSCLQKVTGDFLPGTDTAAGFVPGTGSYDAGSPTLSPILPKDENDLGVGNGITTPLVGQLWYNTFTGTGGKTLYTYTGTTWHSAMLATGTLDMDSVYGIINLLDPRDNATTLEGSIVYSNDAVTVGWADDRWVNQTGDSMTGNLNFGDGNIAYFGDSNDLSISFIGSPATATIVNNTGDLNITNNGTNVVIESTSASSSVQLFANSTLIADFGTSLLAATLYFGGAERIKTTSAGVDINGELNMGTNKVTNVVDPVDNQDAATKAYVLAQTSIIASVPTGVVMAWPTATAPADWVICGGTTVALNISTHADLFAVLGYSYGGSGSTFYPPDLRGEFIRGADNGKGTDSGRVLGSSQGDAMRNITGTVKHIVRDQGGGTSASGVFTWNSRGVNSDGGEWRAGMDFTLDASLQVPTADENRPVNVAMNYIIKL